MKLVLSSADHPIAYYSEQLSPFRPHYVPKLLHHYSQTDPQAREEAIINLHSFIQLETLMTRLQHNLVLHHPAFEDPVHGRCFIATIYDGDLDHL